MSGKDLCSFHSADQSPTLGLLRFEAEEYLPYMKDVPMTEVQKIEFLQSLWTIMAAFVNYGWGVDSIVPFLVLKASGDEETAVKEVYPTPNFNVAADDAAEKE